MTKILHRLRQDFALLVGFALIAAGAFWASPPLGLIVGGCLISATTIIRAAIQMRNETGDI